MIAALTGSTGLMGLMGSISLPWQTVSPTPTTVPGGGCIVTSTRVTGVCTDPNTLHISVAYRSILPVLILSIGALVLLTVSAVLSKRSRPGLYPLLTTVTGGLAVAASIWEWYDVGNKPTITIGGQIFYDRFSVFFMLLVSVATVLGAWFSDSYLRREGLDGVEAYVLMLMAGSGAMLMAESGGLIMLFLGLEIMSIALYVMAAYHRRRAVSGEAGFKYFILGAFSSAVLLYGVALIYGATGSTQFDEIAGYLAHNTIPSNGVLLGGMALLIVGLGFKVAAVPFHFWTPDVYQGSPTPFTGYMAAVAKAAGFAGLLRVLTEALSSQEANWRPVIWILAVLTLIVGSVLAIAQKDLKRMLAYSSISQAGYVLVGVQAGSSAGTSGALFYLFTYTFIVAGTFAVVGVIQGTGEDRNDLGAVRGLARRRPWLAGAMLILLLAQAGVPLTSGFLAKFYVINAAVQRGQYPLAMIAMLAAAIAAFFYLRVVLLMYADIGSAAPAGDAVAGVSDVADVAPDSPLARLGATTHVGTGLPSASASRRLSGDGVLVAGLEPVATLDGELATSAIEDPPDGPVEVPFLVGLGLLVCVAFTVFAGVSQPIIDFARQATTIF